MSKRVDLEKVLDAFFNPSSFPKGATLPLTDGTYIKGATLPFTDGTYIKGAALPLTDGIYILGSKCVLQGDTSEIYHWRANSDKLLASWNVEDAKLTVIGTNHTNAQNPYEEYILLLVVRGYIDRFLGREFLPSFTVLNNHYHIFEGSRSLSFPLIFRNKKIMSISPEDLDALYWSVYMHKANFIDMLEFIKILPEGTYTNEQIDRLRQTALECKLANL